VQTDDSAAYAARVDQQIQDRIDMFDNPCRHIMSGATARN
jgi:hypothetical protein